MSGYSNDVCQFESTSLSGTALPAAKCSDFIGTPGFDWNNAWFASHGYRYDADQLFAELIGEAF